MKYKVGDMANGQQTSEEIIETDDYVKALETVIEQANLYCEPADEEAENVELPKEYVEDSFYIDKVEKIDKRYTTKEVWEIFKKKRNKVAILFEALNFMQSYNGRSIIDCVALAMNLTLTIKEE